MIKEKSTIDDYNLNFSDLSPCVLLLSISGPTAMVSPTSKFYFILVVIVYVHVCVWVVELV